MIIYCTKATIEEYDIPMPHQLAKSIVSLAQGVLDRETGDALWEWGAKYLKVGVQDCLQVMNFASKFTLFLLDIHENGLENVGNMIIQYCMLLYQNDPQMTAALKRMFSSHRGVVLNALKNKSIIASLNHTQIAFAWDGERFWDYVKNNILSTIQLNHDVNFEHLVTYRAIGKDYYCPGEFFRELVLARYGKGSPYWGR